MSLELLNNPPPDITPSQLTSLKKHIERGSALILNEEKETGAFVLYILGDNHITIAEKTGWPVNVILLTALKYRWYEKKRVLDLQDEKDGARFSLKQMANMLIAGVSTAIQSQMQKVLRGEISPDEVKLIPKDMYAMERFVSIVSQIYKLQEKAETTALPQTTVNVNVANLPSGTSVSASQEEPLSLPPQSLTLEEYREMPREERLKMLQNIPKKDPYSR